MSSARGCFNCGGCAFCRSAIVPLPSSVFLPSIARLPSQNSIPASICSLFLPILPPRSCVPNLGRGRADESSSWIQFFCHIAGDASMLDARCQYLDSLYKIQSSLFTRPPLRNAALLYSIDFASCAPPLNHDSRPPGCQLPQSWHANLVRGVVWCTWCRC